MKLYTTPAFAKAAGVSERQVRYWTDKGLLIPTHVEGVAFSGSGNSRVYDEQEVAVARAIALFAGPLEEWAHDVRCAVINGMGRFPGNLVLKRGAIA